jgi:hypothetical protein
MNHIFSRLPGEVEFLYGSLFALRADVFQAFGLEGIDFEAHDTAWGLQIARRGGRIALLQGIEVTHLKTYDVRSLLQNDFRMPYHWAHIFVGFRRWNELPAMLGGRGFAHASVGQVATLASAAAASLSLAASLVLSDPPLEVGAILTGLGWMFLHRRFLAFVWRRKGGAFALQAALFTFLDNLVMGAGLAAGFWRALTRAAPGGAASVGHVG